MLKVGPKSIVAIAGVFTLCTCIDPYTPKLRGYDSLLVVDGLITDANTSYSVKLSRTFQVQNSTPAIVSDANVFITDNAGNNSNLSSKGNGIYKTDSIDFTGSVGRTYTLHITTKEGDEYISDPSTMISVPDIDSVYFAKDQELVNNGTQTQEGISIYLDSKAGDNNQYYRWAYEETWKFKVPDPKKFNFNETDSSITSVADIKEFCWKSYKSDAILIYSNNSGQSAPVKKEPINFIASDQSDRLLVEYSVLIKQFSVSKTEYDYWDNLKRVNGNGGDIFASQPFSVTSNIHNLNNPKEQVLGYFQVSAVKQKRKFIPFSQFTGMNLPYYHYACQRIEAQPSDYPSPFGPPITWDYIYELFCVTSDYYFVEPLYLNGTNTLEKMVFAKPECANCELTGTQTKPDFWIDLN
jgi:Domain of unknown function (DUF4249)